MVKRNQKKLSTRTKIVLTAFGLGMMALGFVIEDLIIKVGLSDVTAEVIAVVSLVAVLLQFMSLGIKPSNVINRIKSFDSGELITFIITLAVGIYAIANLLGWEGLLSFTGGQLIVVGAFTVIDTYK